MGKDARPALAGGGDDQGKRTTGRTRFSLERRGPAWITVLRLFASLMFHNVRLLMESKRVEAARTALDKVLSEVRSRLAGLGVESTNWTTHDAGAESRGVFCKVRSALPAGFSDDSDGREIPEDEKDLQLTAKGSKVFFRSRLGEHL